MIQGAGSSFDCTVNNRAGLGPSGDYGSAISLNLMGSASAPKPGSIALLALGVASGLSAFGAIRRRQAAR